jgi:hypothetical protein
VLFIVGVFVWLQKTNDWATRTTLKTQDKEHKILHRKLKIGQHGQHSKPRINNTKYYTENYRLGNTNHTKNQGKKQKILHRKPKIGQHEPH